MVRLVLFDIDGTLIRTGGAGVQAFGKVFETEFGIIDGFEKLKFAGRTDYSLVREFFGVHGIEPSPDHFQRFFERYAFWLDHFLHRKNVEICAGIPEFIHGLRALTPAPVIGLLTGNVVLGAEMKLRHVNLWQEFQTGAFADDHEDRDQIAAIARHRGECLAGGPLNHDQVLVVGDTPLDIRCARAINAKVIAVATGGASLEELKKFNPDWAVPDLRHLSVEEATR